MLTMLVFRRIVHSVLCRLWADEYIVVHQILQVCTVPAKKISLCMYVVAPKLAYLCVCVCMYAHVSAC